MKKVLPALLLIACGAAMAAGDGSLDKKDRAFVEKAAAGGLLEVQAGKLAQDKGQNADVKSFGAMLSTDHAAGNEELKALAEKKGVTLPTTLPTKEQKKLHQLASARHFDKNFMHEQGLEDHKQDIKDFTKASKDAKDPDVKAFAEKELPTLHKHLQRAEEITKELKAKG